MTAHTAMDTVTDIVPVITAGTAMDIAAGTAWICRGRSRSYEREKVYSQ